MQRFADDAVQVFLLGLDRQDTLRIGGFIEPRAGALLDSQLNTNNAARELARTWAAIRYLTPQESMR